MGDGLVRIGEVLDGLGTRVGLGRSKDAGVIWSRWTEIVGDAIGAHAEPSSLREGVLKVRADSPAWAAELGYLAADIKTRANALIGRQSVLEVRVWTGPGRIRSAGKRDAKHSGVTAGKPPSKPPAEDPREAFARAREAWRRQRSSEGADPK
ncbi:MAG: DciA family protein [Actinomycetota bacterium]